MQEDNKSNWAFNVRHVAPNLITCIGLSIGLISMGYSVQGNYVEAAWLIVLCVLLDKVDGTVARLLNASSLFGVQMDSFSDLLTFCLAPSALVYSMLVTNEATAVEGYWWYYTTGACLLYVIAGTLRLAKFNVTTETIGNKLFLGIPTTLSGAIVATYILTISRHDLGGLYVMVLPSLLFLLAMLMVSNIAIPKLGVTGSSFWRIFTVANVVGVYVCGLIRVLPEYLLVMAFSYPFASMIKGLFKPYVISPPEPAVADGPSEAPDVDDDVVDPPEQR